MARVEFNEDNALRIIRALRLVENWPQNDASPPVPVRPTTAFTQFVQVTGVKNANGYYPCQYFTYDPDTITFALVAGSDAWIQPCDQNVLVVNENYLARLMGTLQADGKNVWMACFPASSAAIVKLTTGTPDGNGVYTATLQQITAATPSTSDLANPLLPVYFWDPNAPGLLFNGQFYFAIYQGLYTGTNGLGWLYVRDDFRLKWLTSAGAVAVDKINQIETGQDTQGTPADDFIVTNPSARICKLRTNGLTIEVDYCDTDGTIHKLFFGDGLLKSRT